MNKYIDVAKIYYVDLDKIPLDKVLNYCKKYPNRMNYIHLKIKNMIKFIKSVN